MAFCPTDHLLVMHRLFSQLCSWSTVRSCTPFCFSHQGKEGDILCKSPWRGTDGGAEMMLCILCGGGCVWPACAAAAPLTLLCTSLPAATVHEPGAPEQHGPADPEWLFLHQPLQHGACTEQRHGPLALRPAQLHFWRPLSLPGHPFQHRLPRTSQLRCIISTVQHSKVSNMDGKDTASLCSFAALGPPAPSDVIYVTQTQACARTKWPESSAERDVSHRRETFILVAVRGCGGNLTLSNITKSQRAKMPCKKPFT